MDISRSHDTPGSETKDFLIYGNSSSNSTSIFSCQLPSPTPPEKYAKREWWQMTWIHWVDFVTGVQRLRSPIQASLKMELLLSWFTRNAKMKEPRGIAGLGIHFQGQMIELLLQVKIVLCREKYKGNRNKGNKSLLLKGAKYGSLKTMNYINTHTFEFKRPTEK